MIKQLVLDEAEVTKVLKRYACERLGLEDGQIRDVTYTHFGSPLRATIRLGSEVLLVSELAREGLSNG